MLQMFFISLNIFLISLMIRCNDSPALNGVLFSRTPEQCPSVVSLLAESYNPHVRYGAAMALGIACAGTGLREAIALLEPMVMFDPVNFVRQGALIASAMILIQQTELTCPKVSFFRQTYAQVISNKHEDVMAKFGAILAQGNKIDQFKIALQRILLQELLMLVAEMSHCPYNHGLAIPTCQQSWELWYLLSIGIGFHYPIAWLLLSHLPVSSL